MIKTPIRANNLEGLDVLWKGIYYHDQDNHHFESDTYTAAEFGNLTLLQYVINGYWYYPRKN